MKSLHHLPRALSAVLVACPLWASAQQFSLEGAVVDSRSGSQLGVVSERGDIASLFRAQKALTFGILRSAGISLDQLSPELRARIERLQTTNLEAFRAYAQGLDLKDQGRFTEAREQFRRAAELDPGFELAREQQQAMPDVNLTAGVQARAVIAAAASTAVDRGRAVFAVDVARAAAALQAGLEVVRIPVDTAARRLAADDPYTINPPGSAGSRTPSQVVGLAYTLNDGAISFSTILPSEWKSGEVAVAGGVLQTVGTSTGSVQLRQASAVASATGRADLPGGGVAYWGSWLSSPGASAVLRSGARELQAPELGRVDWITADTPLALPGSGSYTFTPVGGSLRDVTGSIRVDIPSRGVAFDNLGFRIDTFTFSGLQGSTSFSDTRLASAPFEGRFTAGVGSCPACPRFDAGLSVFQGHFVGREGQGMIFSTLMVTGPGTTASGVHLFTRPVTPGGP